MLNKHSGTSKRVLDFTLGSIALAASTPISVLIAAAIRIESRGPVLFRQPRAGLHGQPFTILKFRTMKWAPESKDASAPEEWHVGVPDDFVFKSIDTRDPRVTRVGHFLRKTSLDELPQLINVLRGEMSLVGPRPELLSIASQYNDAQKRRLDALPGITGWAQVNGRADSAHGEKIRNDLFYIENRSIFLDLRILYRTLVIALTRKGAI